MADVEVVTTVSQVRIVLSLQEARALLQFFGTLDPATAPPTVQEIARRFRSAVKDEFFVTIVT